MQPRDAKTVLVVDDDRDLLPLIALVLEGEGYIVQTAVDGLEALAILGRSVPDLILLDMRMPVMNGWEFAREFRAQYDFQVPIVVLTASQDAKRLAREIEAVDWIGKPFDLDTLVDVVNRNIGKE